MLATAKSDQRLLTSTTVGYLLAPRINAMGRLAHGMDALRLLCSQNPAQVAKLTTLLTETNSERQDLTRDLFEEALEKAKEQSEEHVIIVYSENYHEGIIGLIAGRLMERFWKPVIVLSVAKTTAKASVRSIPGIHITDFLRNFKEQMTSLGGHPMAAGFGVENTKLEALVAAIQKKARKAISTDILEQMLTVECQLSKELASLALLQVLEAFAPFGAANPYPVFALHDLEVASAKSMGKDGTHLVVTLSTAEDSYPLKVIGWRQARRLDQFEVGSKVTIAGYFEKNVWRDKEYLQFILKDVQQV